jgi:hypothetical protein
MIVQPFRNERVFLLPKFTLSLQTLCSKQFPPFASTLDQQLSNVGKQINYADNYFNPCWPFLLLAIF